MHVKFAHSCCACCGKQPTEVMAIADLSSEMHCEIHLDSRCSGACSSRRALHMSSPTLLPNLQHWFSPSVSLRLQQLCRGAAACQSPGRYCLDTGPSRQPHTGYGCRASTRLFCLKPGQSPEDVVKRIGKGQLLQCLADDAYRESYQLALRQLRLLTIWSVQRT